MSLILDVKVAPKSARSEVVGAMEDGALKVKVAAVPEGGKANAELCAVLARHFGVPKQNVTVVSGLASTRKRVRVEGVSAAPGPGRPSTAS
jgi:uncharacterized protein